MKAINRIHLTVLLSSKIFSISPMLKILVLPFQFLKVKDGFVIMALVVSVVIILYLINKPKSLEKISLLLILAGAIEMY